MKQLFIIDGYFFLYRAWHAYASMNRSDGPSHNMVYGFWRMIIHLLALKPDQMVIVRDSIGKVSREDILPTYKANRASMPDDFRQQISLCKSLCTQLGIPSKEQTGYEADDIIYTLAKNYPSTQITQGDTWRYIIYSADKDLKQILEFDHVLIRDPIKEDEWNKASFQRSFWFDPYQIIDYLSLVWDSSDNIPGARGIWPKWATELIKTYGSIEWIYDNLDMLSEKTREIMLSCRSDIEKAHVLISLIEVPEIHIDLTSTFKPDFLKRKTIFVEQYNFQSFWKILDDLKKQRYFSPSWWLF